MGRFPENREREASANGMLFLHLALLAFLLSSRDNVDGKNVCLSLIKWMWLKCSGPFQDGSGL